MEGLNSTNLLTAAAVAAVCIAAFIFFIVAFARARKARRLEIEESEKPRIPKKAARKPVSSLDVEEEGGEAESVEKAPSTAPVSAIRRDKPEPKTPLPIVPPPPKSEQPTEEKAEKAPIPPKTPRRSSLSPGLARTREGWISRLGQIFAGKREIDPSLVEEIERTLLTADIGVRTSQALMEEIKSSLKSNELKSPAAIWSFLKNRSRNLLSVDAPKVDFRSQRPFVILTIGVNGSGKTTTIGKLAARLKNEGLSVLLAAGDTFRAAAVEQLEIWGQRVDAPVVRGKEGSDPSSVLFDATRRAVAEGIDVVIADTAGRLHTKSNLMEELQKVRRVIGKALPGAPHETWLVIDSTSGQNAIAQAQIFTEAMAVSGVVLTKLDGTAKGGVILGISDQLKLPVRFIGVGEKVEDLRPFDPEEFVDALFEDVETLS